MLDEKQTELATTGLGLVALGAGTTFTLFPKLAGWGFGLKPQVADLGGTQVVIRALGFRDIALGIGLLATRSKPEIARLWLRMLSLSLFGDLVACLLALRKPGTGIMTLLGALSSVFFGGLAWITSQQRGKEQL
jgi:hypothetical protein